MAATAVALAWQKAGPNDLICITGSIYVVGDLLNQWQQLQSTLTEEIQRKGQDIDLATSVPGG